MSQPRISDSALGYLISALIPYSDANLKLAFKPSSFFSEIERKSGKHTQTIRNAYYKAIKKGLIELDDTGIPRLTDLGRAKMKLYKPTKLQGNVRLMITFDIPENERWKRRRLRLLLKELEFHQVQKSVWVSKYDYRQLILAEVKQNQLQQYVNIYEVIKLDLTK